ncbi:MAG: hypothetical protein E7653_07060 [Ruminococcaceae bacterium]|nr:hypothetical protein [Oscillospiraceae bacterium]
MKNILKLIVALMLVLCMLVALVACGGDKIFKDPNAATPPTEEPQGEENAEEPGTTNNGGTTNGNISGDNEEDDGNILDSTDYSPVRPG